MKFWLRTFLNSVLLSQCKILLGNDENITKGRLTVCGIILTKSFFHLHVAIICLEYYLPGKRHVELYGLRL